MHKPVERNRGGGAAPGESAVRTNFLGAREDAALRRRAIGPLLAVAALVIVGLVLTI